MDALKWQVAIAALGLVVKIGQLAIDLRDWLREK
jgi:hypothetical protein